MTARRRLIVLATLLGVGMAVPASAVAAPTWLAPVDVAAGGAPQLAMDEQGNTTAVFSANGAVQATDRPVGGVWQPASTLSDTSQSGGGQQLSVNARGDAAVVWARFDGVSTVVEATTRSAGGSWQPAVPLSVSFPGVEVFDQQVAINARGDAIAVWMRYNGTKYIVQASTRAAGGSWLPAIDLSNTAEFGSQPQVAWDAQGNVVVVWRHVTTGGVLLVQARTRTAGGAWQSTVNLSVPTTTVSISLPQLAVDAQGNAVAVWERGKTVQAATRAAGGSWQPATDLSVVAPTQNAYMTPQVSVDPQGNAIAIWNRTNGTSDIVQAATRPAGGSWQPPVNLSAPGQQASNPQVAIDPQGNAVAVWTRGNGTNALVQTARRPAGGTWQPPSDLSAPGQDGLLPQVVMDTEGNALASWYRTDNTHFVVQAAAYDVTGPSLGALAIPVAGVVGQPLTFSASPLDRWSPLGATVWTFGDGQNATGTAVSHTYTTPGTFSVAVDAADAVGNGTSTTRTVSIAPAPSTGQTLPPKPAAPAFSLSGVKLSSASVSRKRKATLSYVLSAAAKVKLVVSVGSKGRKSGKRCAKATSTNKKAKSCVRYTAKASLAVPGKQGRNTTAFTAKLGKQTLKPGRYRLVLTATPASGKAQAKTLTLTVRK